MSTPDITPEAGDLEPPTSFAGASDIGQPAPAPVLAAVPEAPPRHRGYAVELTPVEPVATPYAIWDAMGGRVPSVTCDRCSAPSPAALPAGDDVFDDTRLAALRADWKWDRDIGFACPACQAARAAELDSIGSAVWDDGPGTDVYEQRLSAHVACYCDGAEAVREMGRLRIADLMALARPEDPDTAELRAVAA